MSDKSGSNGSALEGAIGDMDKWDDTVLIDAFNRAMSNYPNGWKPAEQTVEAVSADDEDDVDDNGAEYNEADTRFAALLEKGSQQQATGYGAWQAVDPSPVPPPPPLHASVGDPEGLSDLLMSWYYAGYYTGRFRALQEIRQAQRT